MDNLQTLSPDDYRAEEIPRYFILGIRKIGITRILDHWRVPEHRYLKILGDDGEFYTLKHDPITEIWELIVLDAGTKIMVS
jgi:hypothetical protein